MKFDVSSLKNLDFYKQLGINHGEKIAVAVVGVLLLLALMGTNWHPSDKSPEELVDKAKKADETVKGNPFKEEQAKALAGNAESLTVKIDAMLKPIDGNFAFSHPLNPALRADKTRISKPRWLPVERLLADAGVVNIELNPSVARVEEWKRPLKKSDVAKETLAREKKLEKSAAPKEEPISEEFQSKDGSGGRLGGGGGAPGASRGRKKDDRKDRSARNRGNRGQDDANRLPGQLPGGLALRPQVPNGRGYRFVAIRGIFPLQKQIDELRRAVGGAMDQSRIGDLVQINDFVIERQTKNAKPGADPWEGQPWEPVDRDSALDLLKNEVAGWALDTVDGSITDPAICMPYPERLYGKWGQFATHPGVAKFELSPEEVEQKAEYERRVIDKMKSDEERRRPQTEKKGWNGVALDTRRLRQRALLPGTGARTIQEEILDELKQKNPDPESIDAKLKDYVQKHASATGHLLLFRYLDLFPEPGKTYRYHVKFILQNPFRERQPAEVEDPSIVEGAVRETEFSEPTAPVEVPADARIFLTRADGRVGRASLPSIDLDLYQWFVSTGSIVNQPTMHAQIGQLIAGKETVQVLRYAEKLFEKEKVPLLTKQTLLDVSQGFSLDPNLHADLLKEIAPDGKRPSALSAAVRTGVSESTSPSEGKRPPADAPNQAIVVDEGGTLTLIDSLEQESKYQEQKTRYKQQVTLANGFPNAGKSDEERLNPRGGSSKKERRENPQRRY